MSLAHKTLTFLKMGPEKQLWALTFILGSLVALIAIRTLKMKRLVAFFGQYNKNQSVCVLASEMQRDKAWQIGSVMSAVGRNVPWPCKCLAEALCVKWMLDRYGIPSVTYLGAYLDDEKGMKAHAWVTVERYIVIGGPGSLAYRVTAVFAEPSPLS